ncbi:hypothetical protein [Nocardia sp. NBC_00403]|uniref:hypothetical protein n=1 Tax=Nocardia sp. NBC_00403 TaxID=2975990 RepID=UPI002E1B63A1
MSRRRMFGNGVAAATSVAAGCSADNANTPTAQSNTTTTTTGGNAAGAPVDPVTAAPQAPPAVTPAAVAARHAGTHPNCGAGKCVVSPVVSRQPASRSLTFDACGGGRRARRDFTGHMHRPKSGTAAGMSAALPALRSAGFTIVRL